MIHHLLRIRQKDLMIGSQSHQAKTSHVWIHSGRCDKVYKDCFYDCSLSCVVAQQPPMNDFCFKHIFHTITLIQNLQTALLTTTASFSGVFQSLHQEHVLRCVGRSLNIKDYQNSASHKTLSVRVDYIWSHNILLRDAILPINLELLIHLL